MSQYFCRVDFTKDTYREFFAYSNPEMISFVKEGPSKGAENVAQGLQHVLGNVPLETIQLGGRSLRANAILEERRYKNLSEADRYMAFLRLWEETDAHEIENFLQFSFNDARVEKSVSTALRLAGFYLTQRPSASFVVKLLANAIDQLEDVHFTAKIVPSSNYVDKTFLYSSVLGSSVLRGQDGKANFRPGGLLQAARQTANRGMWCNELGGGKETEEEQKTISFKLNSVLDAVDEKGKVRANKYFLHHRLVTNQ